MSGGGKSTIDEKRIKALARDAAQEIRKWDEGPSAAQRIISDAIRAALSESKWPTCHECGGILIFDQEEPVATCENGCYTTEWGSQANGDHWRDVQKKLMARGQRKISSENPGA